MKIKGLMKRSATHSIHNKSKQELAQYMYTHIPKKCTGFIHSILQQTGTKQDFAAFAES